MIMRKAGSHCDRNYRAEIKRRGNRPSVERSRPRRHVAIDIGVSACPRINAYRGGMADMRRPVVTHNQAPAIMARVKLMRR